MNGFSSNIIQIIQQENNKQNSCQLYVGFDLSGVVIKDVDVDMSDHNVLGVGQNGQRVTVRFSGFVQRFLRISHARV